MSATSISLLSVLVAFISLLFSICGRVSDARDRRSKEIKFQLDNVSAWISQYADASGDPIVVANATPVPVYDVVLSLVLVRGAGASRGEDLPENESLRRWISVVPPGRWKVNPGAQGIGGMHAVAGVELALRDSSGRNWIRRVDGQTESIDDGPRAHYSLQEPVGHSNIESYY